MNWRKCKRILCVRPDNMGDVLMSSPAISALKKTLKCSITLLTSDLGAGVASFLPDIDEVIRGNVPWIKSSDKAPARPLDDIIVTLKEKKFDAAIIFTVFSQCPLPTALMLMQAGIPNRLAYCRENPYGLLTQWLPEKEPYSFIRHQVRRDLDLVRSVGAVADDDRITVRLPAVMEESIRAKLSAAGVDPARPWLLMHPGVSEEKRRYASTGWIQTGKKIVAELDHQVLLTGTTSEKALAESIAAGIGAGAHSIAGMLDLAEFMSLIRFSPLLISANTGSIHLAAALQTKVVVLYALTNPQHTPWRSVGKILPFSVPENLQSRNEVLSFVRDHYFGNRTVNLSPDEIFNAAYDILVNGNESPVDELVSTSTPSTQRLRNEQNFVFP